MYNYIILLVTIASVLAGYSGSSSQAGNGVDSNGQQAYGFAGSQGQYPSQSAGSAPANFPPQFPGFDFNNFLSGYFESLKRYQEQFASNANSYAYTANDLNSNAKAESSLVFDNNYARNQYSGNSLQNAHQNAIAGYGFPGGFPAYAGAGANGNAGGYGFGGSYAGGPPFAGVPPFAGGAYGGNYGGGAPPSGAFGGSYGGGAPTGGAFASGSIGPQGGYQSAAVYPENPENPNILNRFGGNEQKPAPGQGQGQGQGQAPDGFYGVFSSSHSSSSDVDGKKSQAHEAQTTINDNGKITTYKVKNP